MDEKRILLNLGEPISAESIPGLLRAREVQGSFPRQPFEPMLGNEGKRSGFMGIGALLVTYATPLRYRNISSTTPTEMAMRCGGRRGEKMPPTG
jgi:hypothetical protein